MLTSSFVNEPIELGRRSDSLEGIVRALATVRDQFGQTYPLVIGDDRIATDKAIVSTNPSNPKEVIGYAANATIADADRALADAWDAFESWRGWAQVERSRVMLKAAQIMRRRKRELEAWLIYEIGKNYIEASAEVAEMIDFTEYYSRTAINHVAAIDSLNPWPGEENESFYMPLGAGVTIAPWNFPMALMTGMTVGATVVGNTTVCKPASDSVVCVSKVFDIFAEAGVPPGVMNYLPGRGADVGTYLVAHPRTRFINFTGSLATGTSINETAARLRDGQRWIKRVFLELGGKNAILVDETADLDAAAQAAIESAFGYSGQKCSACSRLIAVDSVYQSLLERVVDFAKQLKVGPTDGNPDLGPVCNAAQQQKVDRYLDIGRLEGKLLTGGNRLGDDGYFFEPTVIADVDQNARIAQEEIFGPVLAAIPVSNFEAGLDAVNNTHYGLTGALFSLDRSRLEIARRRFHVGNLYFNRKCTGALAGVQPFGGFNLSGTDTKTGGPDYLLQFLQMKAVAERL